MIPCHNCTDPTQCAQNKHCAYAPSSSHPFFAESVSRAERGLALIVDLKRMAECIREQQAALARCVSLLEASEQRHSERIGLRTTFEGADEARAVLAKWRIE